MVCIVDTIILITTSVLWVLSLNNHRTAGSHCIKPVHFKYTQIGLTQIDHSRQENVLQRVEGQTLATESTVFTCDGRPLFAGVYSESEAFSQSVVIAWPYPYCTSHTILKKVK